MPLPWWMSKSTMATRRTPAWRCTQRAYAAPIATLLSRQNPCEPYGSCSLVTTPRGPAWWPGGRTGQNALRHSPDTTRSIACVTAPAACIALSNERCETPVSASRSATLFGSSSICAHRVRIFFTYA